MNANANFIDDARQIVRDYFEQREPYETAIARAFAGRRSGAYTEDYERGVRISSENAMINLRADASARLAQLEQEFREDLTARTTPSGEEMDSADFRMLRSGLPLSREEFCALCARNDGKETVLRAAGEYAAAHDLTPYFRQYYHTPAERVAAFAHVVKIATVALDAQRLYCSALDTKYWESITADDAKTLGSSADYYKGKSAGWSAADSTLNLG